MRDGEQLYQFRELRSKWIHWLSGQDAHYIWGQINSLIWDYVLFCTVNHLRKLAIEQDESSGLNAAVLRLFDTGFAISQAATIRRLIEVPKANPNWAVISLRRVIKDIRENRTLFTREIYVSYDGLPYDYQTVHDKWIEEKAQQGTLQGSGYLETKGPLAWSTSQRIHKHFDKLAGVSSDERSRDDTMLEKWLDHADSFLECCEPVKIYVDKFVAHAAAPETRVGLPEGAEGLTLEKLEECHKGLYKAASFLYGHVLWEGFYGALPTPQYGHLAGLDQSWASPSNVAEVENEWSRLAAVVEEWESEELWPTDE